MLHAHRSLHVSLGGPPRVERRGAAAQAHCGSAAGCRTSLAGLPADTAAAAALFTSRAAVQDVRLRLLCSPG